MALMAAFDERRDSEARADRDELAACLGLNPQALAPLNLDEAGQALATIRELHDTLHRVRELLATDDLTGATRRAAGVEALGREIGRARRTGEPLAVAFVDLNGLKAINDGQGHQAGDEVLTRLARGLRARLRPYDLVIRWGGDEFVVVHAGATESETSQIMKRIAAELALEGVAIRFGIAGLDQSADPARLIARADQDLYQRKAAPAG